MEGGCQGQERVNFSLNGHRKKGKIKVGVQIYIYDHEGLPVIPTSGMPTYVARQVSYIVVTSTLHSSSYTSAEG